MSIPKRALKRLTVVILSLGGVALLVTGLWMGSANLLFLRNADRAPGDVIKIMGKRGAKGTTLYYPWVRYQPSGQGGAVFFRAEPGLWPSPFDKGDKVEIAYNPNNPHHAKIVSFWMLWFLPVVAALFGVGCLFAARDTFKKTV